MYRKLVFSLCLFLFSVAIVVAQDNGSNGTNASNAPAPNASNASNANASIVSNDALNTPNASNANASNAPNTSNGPDGPGDSDAKMATGMSILGNKEAPMSLFIVPWKSSELGAETNLNRTLNEHDVPVDRDVFMRELDFYQVSVGTPKP